MAVKTEEYGQVCVMTFDGDLAGAESAAARKAVEDLFAKKNVVDYVVDLEKAGFVDSEGLETLLWMKGRCEEMFGQVKLANLDDNCRKILEITRLQHRFECCPDLASALKTMR